MPVYQCYQRPVTQTRPKKTLLALLPELSKATTRTRTRTSRKKGLLLRSLPELSNDEEDLQAKGLKRIKTLLS